MFRSPGVHRVAVGGGITLTFACYPNYFLVQTLEFRNVFSVEVFSNYFTGTYAILSRYFFGYVNFHRNFGGARLKMFVVFMAFL